MEELVSRLRDAGTSILDLRGPLVAGEPWPLSDDWGHTPEADWGPREVLGHIDEMLPYWTEQLEAVLAGEPAAPVPFGRIATDQSRLDRIDADRARPAGEQLDSIAAGLARAEAFVTGLTAPQGARLGRHPTRGDLTVRDSVERFLAAHLEEHVVQLREILARPRGA
jgi:hypothetical protein